MGRAVVIAAASTGDGGCYCWVVRPVDRGSGRSSVDDRCALGDIQAEVVWVSDYITGILRVATSSLQ